MNVLVTGGAGYIGSHACVELLERGDDVVVLDNLSNSFPEALDAVQEITGRAVTFEQGDLLDAEFVEGVFERHAIDAVMHFAGLKAVGESVAQPLRYYRTNLVSTLNLAEAMARRGVFTLVFSSSATVYGDPERVPLDEDCRTGATNPYGATKLMIETMLRDVAASDARWRISLLRYFNPIGAHPSGLIGEDPQDVPNNLMPFIAQVAVGLREQLSVFGDDYDTPDGTGVRDYIHVVDLVRGHLKALAFLAEHPGVHVHNLGTGKGYSVLDMVAAFERVSGRPVPYRVTERRPGDVAQCWADPRKAACELGWSAEFDLEVMCRDAWNWQSRNPRGYRQ